MRYEGGKGCEWDGDGLMRKKLLGEKGVRICNDIFHARTIHKLYHFQLKESSKDGTITSKMSQRHSRGEHCLKLTQSLYMSRASDSGIIDL